MSDFEKLKDQLKDKLTKAQSSEDVEIIRGEIFGKNGLVNLEFKKLGSLSPEDKKKVASVIDRIDKIDSIKWTKIIKKYSFLYSNDKGNKKFRKLLNTLI